MTLNGKNVLILLGGHYHDFEGFTTWAKPVYSSAGCQVEATYDLDRLTRLDSATHLVVSYTSFSRHREGQNDTWPDRMPAGQVSG